MSGVSDDEIELIELDGDESDDNDGRQQPFVPLERCTSALSSSSVAASTASTISTPKGTVTGRQWNNTTQDSDSDASQEDTTDTLPCVSWGQTRSNQDVKSAERSDDSYSEDDYVPPLDDLSSPDTAQETSMVLPSSPFSTASAAKHSEAKEDKSHANKHGTSNSDKTNVQTLSSPLVATPPRRLQTPSRKDLYASLREGRCTAVTPRTNVAGPAAATVASPSPDGSTSPISAVHENDESPLTTARATHSAPACASPQRTHPQNTRKQSIECVLLLSDDDEDDGRVDGDTEDDTQPAYDEVPARISVTSGRVMSGDCEDDKQPAYEQETVRTTATSGGLHVSLSDSDSDDALPNANLTHTRGTLPAQKAEFGDMRDVTALMFSPEDDATIRRLVQRFTPTHGLHDSALWSKVHTHMDAPPASTWADVKARYMLHLVHRSVDDDDAAGSACDLSSAASKRRRVEPPRARTAADKADAARVKAVERQRKRDEKAAATATAKAVKAAQRHLSKRKSQNERVGELVLRVSSHINDVLVAAGHMQQLQDLGATTRVLEADAACDTGVGHRVTWQRRVASARDDGTLSYRTQDECFALHILTAHEFVELIHDRRLSTWLAAVERACGADTEATVVIEGLEKFFRAQASKENASYRRKVMDAAGGASDAGVPPARKRRMRHTGTAAGQKDLSGVTRMTVEMKLVDMQFDTSVRVRLASTAVDTAEYIFMYTKAVATHVDAEHGQLDMGFCPSVCAAEKVDRDSYVGLKRVWMRQVQQFPNVSEAKAEAIAAAYGSPRALLHAFVTKGEHAVRDVPVRRGSSTRSIGPKASEVIHRYICALDGMAMVE
eukprot:m.677816 g.677816  ORF g.677816 m.677816 type:complete len:840 (+) comp22801_c0_seq3:292-2811(+)